MQKYICQSRRIRRRGWQGTRSFTVLLIDLKITCFVLEARLCKGNTKLARPGPRRCQRLSSVAYFFGQPEKLPGCVAVLAILWPDVWILALWRYYSMTSCSPLAFGKTQLDGSGAHLHETEVGEEQTLAQVR